MEREWCVGLVAFHPSRELIAGTDAIDALQLSLVDLPELGGVLHQQELRRAVSSVALRADIDCFVCSDPHLLTQKACKEAHIQKRTNDRECKDFDEAISKSGPNKTNAMIRIELKRRLCQKDEIATYRYVQPFSGASDSFSTAVPSLIPSRRRDGDLKPRKTNRNRTGWCSQGRTRTGLFSIPA
ncbi:hypothetical protein ZHAS_00005894 [Anopheles sinensis]|uniref:Uncharacterized protein n=1 Tax=Anopheles sinensis TaxID=74873 RepID=A0A084VKJ5_ANOSI|nr:hypothetical protein ZHAS_00005894 [Anopheles sinensis]